MKPGVYGGADGELDAAPSDDDGCGAADGTRDGMGLKDACGPLHDGSGVLDEADRAGSCDAVGAGGDGVAPDVDASPHDATTATADEPGEDDEFDVRGVTAHPRGCERPGAPAPAHAGPAKMVPTMPAEEHATLYECVALKGAHVFDEKDVTSSAPNTGGHESVTYVVSVALPAGAENCPGEHVE